MTTSSSGYVFFPQSQHYTKSQPQSQSQAQLQRQAQPVMLAKESAQRYVTRGALKKLSVDQMAPDVVTYGVNDLEKLFWKHPPDKPKNAADVRLANGHALGNVVFSTTVHGKVHRLRCTSDCIGGRGLRVFDAVQKGVTLARGSGTIVSYERALENKSAFKIYDSKNSYLLLDPPTTAMPAHLANTSDGANPNNCRILHKAGTDYFSIITLRALEPNEEVTVAYGSKFTTIVREAAKEESRILKLQNSINCNTLLQCSACNIWLAKRRFKYHTKLVCDAIILKTTRARVRKCRT